MPQQNGWVKWKFAALFNQVHAILNGRKFTAFLRKGFLSADAANTAMLLKNNLISHSRTLSPCQQCFGKVKRSIIALAQKFGEMCIAMYTDNSHGAKLANWVTSGILIGFAEGDPVSTYRRSNTKTKKIFLPRLWPFNNHWYCATNTVTQSSLQSFTQRKWWAQTIHVHLTSELVSHK